MRIKRKEHIRGDKEEQGRLQQHKGIKIVRKVRHLPPLQADVPISVPDLMRVLIVKKRVAHDPILVLRPLRVSNRKTYQFSYAV
jgi:hypothetical protein